MNRFSRFLVLPASIAALLLATTAASFTSWDELKKYEWNPNPNTGGYFETMEKPLLGFYGGVDDGTHPFTDSFIRTASVEQPVCDGFDDPVCVDIIKKDKRMWWTWSMLGPCETPDAPTKCIESIQLTDKDGNSRKLHLVKVLDGVNFPADPKHGLEAGSNASIWTDPLDPDVDRGYLLAIGGGLKISGNVSNPTRASLDFLEANVIPFKYITGAPGVRSHFVTGSPASGYSVISNGGPTQCIWTDYETCGVQNEFLAGSELSLTLHLPSNISGWVFGRIDSPQIAVSTIAQKSVSGFPINRITVTAKPVNVPLYSIVVPIEKANKKLKAAFTNPKVSPCLTTKPGCQHGWVGGSTSGGGEAAFELYDMFDAYLPARAQTVIPKWSFNTLMSEFIPKEFTKCQAENKNQFLGFVTTNATNYLGGAPEFKSGFLNYKVAALHSLPNGDDFIGSYDLVLNSTFARCLYGFTKAPISASVSVTSANGRNQVATTLVGERDGWLSLSAKNFTFSSPTLRIKLNQKKK